MFHAFLLLHEKICTPSLLFRKKKRLHKRHYSRFETPLPTAGLGGVWFIAAVMRGASIITWDYSHQPAVLLFRKQRKTNNKSAKKIIPEWSPYNRLLNHRTNTFSHKEMRSVHDLEPSNEHIFSQRNAKCAWRDSNPRPHDSREASLPPHHLLNCNWETDIIFLY